MHDLDGFKLLGEYKTPRFKYGSVVTCAIRGPVKIIGLTAARIPWPKGRFRKRGSAIILYGALADAVRRKSVEAIKHWFGVGNDTVWKWRKALGVEGTNAGTSALLSRWAPETVQSEQANVAREPALKTPERAAKIAAAKRGKPRPAHVIEAMRAANTGKKASKEAREKMSEANKRRGTRPPAAGVPWTAEEDALLGTMKDKDVAARTGRTDGAVSDHRYVLGVPAFVKRAPRGKSVEWTPAKERLLGTMPDTVLARRLRCSPMMVRWRRKRLGIPAHREGRIVL
jgi:hypothetical protein